MFGRLFVRVFAQRIERGAEIRSDIADRLYTHSLWAYTSDHAADLSYEILDLTAGLDVRIYRLALKRGWI